MYITFEHYQNQESLIHHLDPRVKVVVTVLFVISNALLPDGAWAAFALSWLMLLGCIFLARLNLVFIIKRSLVVLPFTLAAATAIFTFPGQSVFCAQIGSWHLTATDAGLVRFFSILIRSWVSVQMAIVLTASTPFPDLIHALRHLRVPSILVAIISFMYRYIFVLSDEAMRLIRAREARSARLRGGSKNGGTIKWRAKVAGNMAGQLFLRSYERSERVYNAMLSRGYRRVLLTINPHVMRSSDWVVGGAAIFMLFLILMAGRV
ncbi:MAG: cobalt ECF transporter T component CbiQ [Chloroflexota bacterium]|nr:cobalt ECF transporter T component CbiQ [Chloroflexota bacterium]